MNKRCCFAGHGNIHYTEDVYRKLVKLIEKMIITENVSEFWVGNYGSFDKLSARAVRSVKEKHPHIKLNLVIPYLTSEINTNKTQYHKNYDYILIADIPQTIPKKLHILKCNEYMVHNSDFIICYVKYSWGGAAKTSEYAQKKNIEIFNL